MLRRRLIAANSAHNSPMTTAEAATEMLDSPAAEPRSWSLRRLLADRRRGAGAAVGLPHLRGADRADADRADPRSRHQLPRHQLGDDPAAPDHHRHRGLAGRPGAPAGQGGVAAACAGRRRCFRSSPCCRRCWSRSVANVTLDRGLDRLFNTRTKAVIENSVVVAHAYLQGARAADPRRHHRAWPTIWRARGRCSIRIATASAAT